MLPPLFPPGTSVTVGSTTLTGAIGAGTAGAAGTATMPGTVEMSDGQTYIVRAWGAGGGNVRPIRAARPPATPPFPMVSGVEPALPHPPPLAAAPSPEERRKAFRVIRGGQR